MEQYRFITYEDMGGQWRWRLIAENGLTVADSAEGYASKENAQRAITAILSAELTANDYD